MPSAGWMTATLTAADGSVPVGVPLGLRFENDGHWTDVGPGPVTDVNGQHVLGYGYPDYGTTYEWYTPGDGTYGPSTGNDVHISAPVTTTVNALSTLAGATVSGYVRSLHGVTKPGMTVELYATDGTSRTLVSTQATDSIGGWLVSLPTIVTPTFFQAVVLSDTEDTGSDKTLGPVLVSTRTTLTALNRGGSVTVRGAVVNGNGIGTANVSVQIDTGSHGSAVRTLRTVSTDSRGHYTYTGRACSTACFYEAVASDTAASYGSFYVGKTMKAPTHLAMTVRRGSPDRVTAVLTSAADHSAVAGQKVTVYYRFAGHKYWHAVAARTTSRSGTVTLSMRPGRSTYVMARFAGNSSLVSTRTGSVHVAR